MVTGSKNRVETIGRTQGTLTEPREIRTPAGECVQEGGGGVLSSYSMRVCTLEGE